jgi:hypothetical protein
VFKEDQSRCSQANLLKSQNHYGSRNGCNLTGKLPVGG